MATYVQPTVAFQGTIRTLDASFRPPSMVWSGVVRVQFSLRARTQPARVASAPRVIMRSFAPGATLRLALPTISMLLHAVFGELTFPGWTPEVPQPETWIEQDE